MKRSLLTGVLGLLACGTALAQRLPGGIYPDHYSLNFTIHFADNNFDGDETIDLKLDKPSTTITLNAVEITFHDVSVTANGQTQAAKVSTDEKNEMATFTVDKAVPTGTAKVHIKYTGQLNDKLRGLYLSTYNGRKYAVSQMEAVDARVAFPSFDQPEYKATFDISATVDKGDTAISNNQEISDTPGPGDQHTIKFATSPKMSSYLVALTVGDWKCASDEVEGIKLRVCTVPGKENLTHYPLEATKAILKYYNDYYGIKYPLAKLDQIAVPDFQAGAMENWGAIVYRETALLIDEKTASVGAKKGVAETIAHEVAHQWFGDLVTMQWWDDIWLNEGFATWMTPHPLEKWQPEWLVPQDTVENTMNSLANDATRNTRPIHQAAEIRGEIESLFDGIAYGKTAAVLHMLESYLGHDTFRAGVNLYLKEHAYGNATASDFWSAMARSSHKPIDQIMPTFVMQPGEPFLGVEAKCDGGNTTLNLSQKRYINNLEGFNEPNDQLWQIPVRVKGIGNGAGQDQTFILTKRQQQFTMKGCSKFIFPDAGALGYYRFDYDTAALHQLGKAAEEGLTPEERIALIGNEWALMRVGMHGVGDYLALGDQLKDTPGSVLLTNFVAHLEAINHNIVTDADRPQFQAWLRRTFSPLLQQLGYDSKANESPEVKQKRAVLYTVLGNLADDPSVIEHARTITQDYMKDPNSVDGTLSRAAISVAARHGDAGLYAQFKAKLKEQGKSPEEYYRYFYGLADFPESDLIQQTLDWTLTPDVRGQDLYVLLSIIGNPNGETPTWDFMRAHYEEISKKTGGGLGGAGIFQYAVPSFCDAEKRDQVKQFFQQHPMPGTERLQKEAIETIDSCISLRDQQSPKLAAWLQQNGTANASNSNGNTGSNAGMKR
jgi:aminopeptidase N